MDKLSKIERELEHDRAEMSLHLQALQSVFSPAALVGTGSELAMDYGDRLADTARSVAGQNRIPLTLTGIGLAWMAAKSLTGGTKAQSAAFVPEDRPTAPGFRTPQATESFDERLAQADAAAPGRFGTETMKGELEMSQDERKTGLRDRAYASAEILRERIEDGLDRLPEDARERVRAARRSAIAAQSEVQARARQAATGVSRAASDNPLLIGALAFAAGAAVAAALPRTRIEDRTLGQHRDRLFDRADAVLRDELANLRDTAEEAVAKGRDRAKEAVGEVADRASAAVADMAPSDTGKCSAA